jgi:DNA mismatch endonuclease (patch repair protein)
MTEGEPTLGPVSPATRRVMQANRGRDTSPELAVRSRLHARGLRYRVATPLQFDRRRRSDIYFSRAGLYIFIDGCYWHGCPEHFIEPKTNVEFWRTKIEGNRRRDVDTTSRLIELGFHVLRFWEHCDPAVVVEEICDRYFHAGRIKVMHSDSTEDDRWRS